MFKISKVGQTKGMFVLTDWSMVRTMTATTVLSPWFSSYLQDEDSLSKGDNCCMIKRFNSLDKALPLGMSIHNQ